MIRVVFGGDGPRRASPPAQFTDHYVKLQLPAAGAAYCAPFDPRTIRGDALPREQWPRTRTYTVRRLGPERAAADDRLRRPRRRGRRRPVGRGRPARRQLQLVGPGGAYAPDPDADWHLLVGDASVHPGDRRVAARGCTAGVPGARRARGRRRRSDQQPLTTPADLQPRRGCTPRPARSPLLTRCAALELPARRRPRVRPRRGERRCAPCAATCSSSAGSARGALDLRLLEAHSAPRRAGARTRPSGTASSRPTPPHIRRARVPRAGAAPTSAAATSSSGPSARSPRARSARG